MSKVPYTINVDEYVCTALEQMRGMVKVLDFSGLPAAIERVQHHANQMENALYTYESIKHQINKLLEEKDLSDEDFKKKVVDIMERINKNQG
jgi:predicted  nucleic acid-binding Zn-ribbon protein